jgi:hypothetical protein
MSFVDPPGQWFMYGDPDRKCPSIVSMVSELMFPVSGNFFPKKTQKNFRWLKILRILLKSSVCIARIVNSQPVTVAGGAIWEMLWLKESLSRYNPVSIEKIEKNG